MTNPFAFHNIQAVLMDMDGTLFDTEVLSMEGWKRGATAYGLPMTEEQILSFRGHSATENEGQFVKFGLGTGEMYWEVRKVRTDYIAEYMDEHGVPEKEGLWELLDFLKESGLDSVVATGTAREKASRYWELSGILPYVTSSICGDEVEKAKPDPEIFRKAAAKVKVPIENCVILEDSPNGIAAALASGAHVIMIPDQTPATEENKRDCDFVVDSLHEVPACLKLLELTMSR